MALGYIDPDSGTYFYGDDDPSGPLSDVLNDGALAEHNARLADRVRLDNLEASTPITAPLPTAVNGYVRDPATMMMKVGGLVFMSLVLTIATGVDDVVVATLPAGYRPPSAITVQGVASQGGSAAPVTIVINPSGDIRCWTASSANQRLDLSTFWVTA